MSKKTGFTSMASAETTGEITKLGVGMLGYSFMGKMYSNGFKKMPYIFWPPPAEPKLIRLCGRSENNVKEAARRYGYSDYSTNWKDIIEDDRIDIFVNGAPNNIHLEPCIEAAKSGKHIICEKPLAMNSKDAKKMLDAVKNTGIKHICNFNYRMLPALTLAKKLIMDGKIGKIYHFRARYLQEWITDPAFPMSWRLSKKTAGSGTVGDLGSHVSDLARWLCGEPKSVVAQTKTFIDKRPFMEDPNKIAEVDVDDAFSSIIEFENGAIGVLEASRFCLGNKNHLELEINGELGSIKFSVEDMNRLQVYYDNDTQEETKGFHDVLVTEMYHPYYDKWWPHGHIIGWDSTFVHTIYNMVNAIINNTELEPMVGTFEDGYKTSVICDAILESAKDNKKVYINY